MVNYYYPRRFNKIVQNPYGHNAYKSYLAIKTSMYDRAVKFVQDQEKEYNKIRKELDKAKVKFFKKRDELNGLRDLESNDEKVQKKIAKLEEEVAILEKEYGAIVETARDFVEAFIDSFTDEFYEIAKTFPRGLTLTNLMITGNPFGFVMSHIEERKKDPWLHYDSDELIGDKSVVDQLYPILDAAKDMRSIFQNEFSKKIEVDVSKLQKRSDKKIAAAENLAIVYTRAKEKLSIVNDLRKIGGGNSLADYKALVQEHMKKILSAWGSVASKEWSVFPDAWNRMKNGHQAAYSALEAIMKARDIQDAFVLFGDFETRLYPIAMDSIQGFIDISKVRKNNIASEDPQAAFWYFEGQVQGGEGADKIGFVKRYYQAVLDPLEKYYRKYPALLEEAHKAGLFASKPPSIPRAQLMMKPDQIESRLEKPMLEYLDYQVNKIEELIEFAKLFTGVKSLYPLAIPTKAMAMRDPYGRTPHQIHYAKSMDRLLNEAISGESIHGTKAVCLVRAYRFYPSNKKVQLAYRTYQRARIEGWY